MINFKSRLALMTKKMDQKYVGLLYAYIYQRRILNVADCYKYTLIMGIYLNFTSSIICSPCNLVLT
jgi:hypothetical protein